MLGVGVSHFSVRWSDTQVQMWFAGGDGDSDEGRFYHGVVTGCSAALPAGGGDEEGDVWVWGANADGQLGLRPAARV